MSLRSSVAVYTVPTEEPESDGTARWRATTVVTVELSAGGHTGLGWSYTVPAAADVVRDQLIPLLRDARLDDIASLRAQMLAEVRNTGATGVVSAALSAVDIALWDLKAQRLETPISALLGQVRPDVPVYGSGGFTSYDDPTTVDELEHWLDLGIHQVKIKIGQGWGTDEDRDLARVALTRRAVGPDVGVFVDANGGYSTGQAIRIEHRLREHDVSWFEEPVSSDWPRQLAKVRDRACADIAAGEYIWRLADAAVLLQHEAVDCLQADVTRCGGYSAWAECAALAAAHGIEVSAHCAPQLAAHVAVTTPNLRHLEFFRDHERVDSLLFDGVLPVQNGTLRPDPDRTGHGMHLRPAAQQFRQR